MESLREIFCNSSYLIHSKWHRSVINGNVERNSKVILMDWSDKWNWMKSSFILFARFWAKLELWISDTSNTYIFFTVNPVYSFNLIVTIQLSRTYNITWLWVVWGNYVKIRIQWSRYILLLFWLDCSNMFNFLQKPYIFIILLRTTLFNSLKQN